MADLTLVLIEAAHIQAYVFSSNQLAQNIGASEIIARACSQWVVEALEASGASSNGRWSDAGGLELADEGIAAGRASEIVYEGGGAAMLLFREASLAERFIQTLTRLALDRAPGLELLALAVTFDADREALADAHPRGRRDLARWRHERCPSTPLMGLGVTAACVYTGLPAIGYDDDPRVVGQTVAAKARATGQPRRLISAEVAAKLRMEEPGRERLHRVLRQVRRTGFEFVYDFDDFGDPGESSYLAVIHADANGMGRRFEAIQKAYRSPDRNWDYIKRLRRFSQEIKQRAETALQATVDALLASRRIDDNGHETFGGVVSIRSVDRAKGSRRLLPFRPIVFGGDDATFVADGRLGLSLAARYIQEFTEGMLSDGEPIFARAGVGIVKNHFPFARAYELADTLSGTAKKAIEMLLMPGEDGVSVIDWHIASTGVIRPLKDIRAREYMGGGLLMRPVRVPPSPDGPVDERWRTWDTFASLVQEFSQGQARAERRNKVMALREALRGGPESVSLFLANHPFPAGRGKSPLPDVDGQPEMAVKGWQGGRTAYFDAIEALEFFVPLSTGDGGSA